AGMWTIDRHANDEGFACPGTAQAASVDELDTTDAVDITKTRDDAFHGTRLDEVLTELGVTHLLLGGVSTHSCVAATATSAFAHGYHVAIAGDAIASENTGL